MSDISMCQDDKCPQKLKCWRQQAPVSQYAQCYGDFAWGKYNKEGKGCDYFWQVQEVEQALKGGEK